MRECSRGVKTERPGFSPGLFRHTLQRDSPKLSSDAAPQINAYQPTHGLTTAFLHRQRFYHTPSPHPRQSPVLVTPVPPLGERTAANLAAPQVVPRRRMLDRAARRPSSNLFARVTPPAYLPLRMNDLRPLSGSDRCPVCNVKVPFSLAMHMVAAHSPNAIENAAQSPDVTLREIQASAYLQSHQKDASDVRRPNRPRRGKRDFARGNGKRGH